MEKYKTINNQIGERIKERRIELGLTQNDVAKRMGLTNRTSIMRYEKGERTFTTKQIESFAKAIDVTPSYLMGWDEENEEAEKNSEDFIFDEFCSLFKSLSQENQQVVLTIMKSLNTKKD